MIPEKVIKANLVEFYYIKLCKTIRTSFFVEDINSCHFSDLLVDIKNDIRQFNCLQILDNLSLTMIRDMHNQIAKEDLDYQKIISFIA